jgi:hypothetical protein
VIDISTSGFLGICMHGWLLRKMTTLLMKAVMFLNYINNIKSILTCLTIASGKCNMFGRACVGQPS